MKRDFLKWFSGKALANAEAAADLFEQSIAQDCWVPGASVKCRAAFSKTNVAHKLFTSLHRAGIDLERLGVPEGVSPYHSEFRAIAHMGFRISFALQFGNFRLDDVDFDACRKAANGNEQMINAINAAEQATADFAEVYELMRRFDAMRPRPVFTTMGASPLVSETMKSMNAASVEVCPIEWKTVPVKNEKGELCYEQVGILLWPEGIMHGASGKGCAGYWCEACGHKISNLFNWVPLIITSETGEKKSLWVGKDCSKTLFGIDMKGDLRIVEGR